MAYQSTRVLAEIDLDYALAMDERMRHIVQVLREKKSCLILDPERLEQQEEEAAAELYVVLQEVSRCKVVEANLERDWKRAQDEAYNRELEHAQLRRDQWKAYDDWTKRKGPAWDALKNWEKTRDAYERKKAVLNLKNTTPAKAAEIHNWLVANPLPPRPKDPPEPVKPEGLSPDLTEVKVTDVKKTAAVAQAVDRAFQAYANATKERREAEDYCLALQQKLSLISGMQGARNRGI